MRANRRNQLLGWYVPYERGSVRATAVHPPAGVTDRGTGPVVDALLTSSTDCNGVSHRQ